MTDEELNSITTIGESRQNLEYLVAQLKTPLRVIPFVGADLSKEYNIPLLQEFLLTLAQREDLTIEIEAFMKLGQFEESAEYLLDAVDQASLLFLGCSLENDRSMLVLNKLNQELRIMVHYAIIEQPENEEEFQQMNKRLSSNNIRTIWYPHGQHRLLNSLLLYLTDQFYSVINLDNGLILNKRNRPLTGPHDSLLTHEHGFFSKDKTTKTVSKVKAALSAGKPELIIVTGAPGIGKTEICKEALKLYLQKNPDETIYYINLTEATSKLGLIGRLTDALGIPQGSTENHILNAVRNSKAIFYLDNLEDALKDSEARNFLYTLVQISIRPLLSSCRESLLGKRNIPVHTLEPETAMNLFRHEWKSSGAETEPDADLKFQEFIQNDLACHPLSLILVAAQGYFYSSLPELRTQWKQSYRITELEREANTLITSLDVSLIRSLELVQLIIPEAVLFWGVMGFFSEGMSMEAVKEIFKDEQAKAHQMIRLLTQLNLLERRNGLLHILPALKQYILGRKIMKRYSCSREILAEKVYPYFSKVAKEASNLLQTDRHDVTLDKLLAEFEHLCFFMRYTSNLGGDWLQRVSEISNDLQNVYQFNIALGMDNLTMLSNLQRAASLTMNLANTFHNLGNLELRLGQVDLARQHYEEAISLFNNNEGASNNLGLANTLQSLGNLELSVGQVDLARQHYEKAIPLYKNERANLGLANTLHSLGILESKLGQVDLARRHYEKAIPLYKNERANLGLANTFQNLGDLERRLGQIDLARQHYDKAILLYKNERANLGLANTFQSLGDLELRLGQVDLARRYYDKALLLFKDERVSLGLANTFRSLGDLESRLGHVDLARRHYEKAIPLYKNERANLGLANTLQCLGDLESRAGQVNLARQHYDKAIPLFKAERDNLGLANTFQSLGDLENKLGHVDLARELYKNAILLYKGECANLGLANTFRSLGDMERRLGQLDLARQHYEKAIPLFKNEHENMGLACTYAGMGLAYKSLGENEPSKDYLSQAYSLALNYGSPALLNYVHEVIKVCFPGI